jgi:hypothetical protein
MNKYTIIPSSLQYKSAPFIDQEISLSLEEQSQQITEYDRSQSISLAQIYDDERQSCTIFRPTFKVNYIYANTYTGTTEYLPFKNNLYYVEAEKSVASGKWFGYPQYYEFDLYRPNVSDQHIQYQAKSAYTYNWTYYLSYVYRNNYDEKLFYELNNSEDNWTASEGIPYIIRKTFQNGNPIIQFQCIVPHGLSVGEYVKIKFKNPPFNYNNIDLFQVYSLGNGLFDSKEYIFNIYDVGYTGTTFTNRRRGTFRRVINPENILETTSEYYVRQHKILTNVDECIITKNGFEKNVFNEEKKFEYDVLTPDDKSRISQKTSSNSYNITFKYDFDLNGVLDNQKRPVSELFLTIINKGYTGYFNKPSLGGNVALKQGWKFNLTQNVNSWWDDNNVNSNTNIPTSNYTLTSGVTKTFYYNRDLMSGDTMDGDFCEWNNYEQIERVISGYFHKLKYNQDVFATTSEFDRLNAPGFYYQPHTPMTIRVFSDYRETGDINIIVGIPSYSYYSSSDQEFRWRDLYTYGFIDNLDRGVDYPFLNFSHYPFKDVQFRLIPDGINYNSNLNGIEFPIKPLIDGCE